MYLDCKWVHLKVKNITKIKIFFYRSSLIFMSVYFLMAQPGTLVLKEAAFTVIQCSVLFFSESKSLCQVSPPAPPPNLLNYGVSLENASLVYCETGMRQNTSCFNLFVSNLKNSLDSNIKSMKLINPTRVFSKFIYVSHTF